MQIKRIVLATSDLISMQSASKQTPCQDTIGEAWLSSTLKFMFYPHSQSPHLQTYKEAVEIIRTGLLPSGLVKLLVVCPLGTKSYIYSFMSQGHPLIKSQLRLGH